ATARVLAKPGRDTTPRGQGPVNLVATQSPAGSAAAATPQPLRWMATNRTASATAAIPSAAGRTGGKTLLSLWSTATATVHERNPATASRGRNHSLRAALGAPRQRAPARPVGREGAPWEADRTAEVKPPRAAEP